MTTAISGARRHSMLAVLGILAVLVAGCAGTTIGAGPEGGPAAAAPADSGAGANADEPLSFDDTDAETAAVDRGTVTMARANWSSGAMQAEIYAQLLEAAGYTVDRGGELAPEEFYPALAEGDYDFWANGWPIVHTKFFDDSTADGTRVGDLIEYVGAQMPAGGLQGFLVDIATADRLGITTLDDIANNPAIRAEFDTDGDGRAEIAGCDVGWGCEKAIDQLITLNGWDDLMIQIKGIHSELFAEQVAREAGGQPVLAYVWTPGPFITQLRPGQEVIWLGVENPDPSQAEPADLPDEHCRLDPCTMGFSPSDIRVVARSAFLADEPVAARILESVRISVLDVSFQNVKMLSGENTPEDIARHATEWIEANRSDVDRWLEQASLAG